LGVPLRIVVTGGITGGHIFPAIATAEAILSLEPNAEVRFVGGSHGMEASAAPEAGLEFVALSTRRIRKIASVDGILGLLSLLRAYGQAYSFLGSWRPQAVFGTGGYVSAITCIAAVRRGIPTTMMEPNAVAGRINQWLGKHVKRVCISYPEAAAAFPNGKTILTGTPIRQSLLPAMTKQEARERLGITSKGPVVLALGGSQGALRLNEIILGAAPCLKKVHILHQTGKAHLDTMKQQAEAANIDMTCYRPVPFFSPEDMGWAYRAADVAVTRCGSTLAEVAANGLPAFLIPLPNSQGDHQLENARSLEKVGGGVLLRQEETDGARLGVQVQDLLADGARLREMAAASLAAGKPDAAKTVAQLILEDVNRIKKA
jgi:UDP-N-acetylglucosamine--N-acetylmuramyl-(pentapeptide) pyrophosphoryl-undecaprenol N-acetylglucosamine transferase